MDKLTPEAPLPGDALPTVNAAGPTSTGRAFQWWHSVLIFLCTVIIADWPILSGNAFEHWDAFDLSSPYFCLIADFLRAHQLLLWNPWTSGGSPDFADAGSGSFSPIMLAFGSLGSDPAMFRLYWLFIWALGGIGMLCLARHLRAPAWGGLVVALGYYFSGYNTGHAGHTSVVYTFAFLPLIIWRLDTALDKRRIWGALEAGALWGISALGGYPLLVVLTGTFAGLWAVGRWGASDLRTPGRLAFNIAAVAILGALGLVILSPSYFSFLYECAGFTGRSHAIPLAMALENSLHPGALTTISSPYLPVLMMTGNPGFWAGTDVSSCSIYMGGVSVVLAFLALMIRGSRGWRWFLLAVALLALGCSLGEVLPLRSWLYTIAPPTRFFRHPSMFRGYFLFCMFVLALAGARHLEILLRSNDQLAVLKKLLIAAVISGVAGVVIFLAVLDNVEFPGIHGTMATVHNHGVWLGLAGVALVALGYRMKFRVGTWVPAALVGIAIFDGLLTMRLSAPIIYTAGVMPPFKDYHVASLDLGAAGFNRRYATYKNVNIYQKIPTLRGYTPLTNRFFDATIRNKPISLMALGSNRVWFSSQAPEVPWTDETFSAFKARVDASSTPIILRHARPDVISGVAGAPFNPSLVEAATPAIPLTPEIIHYSSNRLTLRIDCPADGWVLVTDRWSRSWKATVNKVELPVWCGNFLFRVVEVKGGSNEIDFEFVPKGLLLLLPLSWGTLAIILVSSVWIRVRRLISPTVSTFPDQKNED